MDPVSVPAKFEVRSLLPKFNGLLFRSILWMCVQNLKFVSLPIPEIIRIFKKFGQSLDMPTLPFLPNFSWTFVRIYPVNVSAPTWSWSTNVTDGRTDGRTTCSLNTAICTKMHRAVKWRKMKLVNKKMRKKALNSVIVLSGKWLWHVWHVIGS